MCDHDPAFGCDLCDPPGRAYLTEDEADVDPPGTVAREVSE